MTDDPTAKARELIAKILEVAPEAVTDDADFRDDLEADSLQLAEINAVLEDDLGLDTVPGEPPSRFAEIRDLLAAEAPR
ncbi:MULTISPECIES: acyl carrier protein [Glycomyces]|uniref:Acyl carrier protein n=2 Tax=Glycomyces TaxID=58113 RepID=A0A9X3SU97_9ACTN|nr:phosphopantetheine-binding protein [Glycomyces lechevalierae]MDA1383417.1 phosphopantetheine-binding protein [Glycomyces lechevalierae]MDR7336423.1 acyl carrier protein [Glycomyces lechevalierae]